MSRFAMTVVAASCAVVLGGCDSGGGGQPLDMSKFDEFAFARTINIRDCFAPGDLVTVRLSSQAGNRVLDFTTLEPAEGSEAPCAVESAEGHCLVESAVTSRVLEVVENQRIDRIFTRVLIASEPHLLCSTGNVTTCSDDLYVWDSLSVSGDFCQPVHVINGPEMMGLLRDLRDGPPDESEAAANPFDPLNFNSGPVDILRVESIIASDQLLGKNGDFVVVRTQSDLDGVLLQDGSAMVDFESEIAVAVVVIRPPCQQLGAFEGLEAGLVVELRGTMGPDDDCFFDLGSIDAYLVVIPRTPKIVRLFLNNSELDEIHL